MALRHQELPCVSLHRQILAWPGQCCYLLWVWSGSTTPKHGPYGSRELLLFWNETGSNLTPPQTKKEEQGRELLPFQSVRIPPWSVVRNSAPPTTSLILFSLGHIVSYSPGRPQTGYAYKDVLKLVTLLSPSTCREPGLEARVVTPSFMRCW